MKTYGINIIDEFLLEKSGNEGINKYSIKTYTSTFNLLLTCKYIDIYAYETFTEFNFKRFLLEGLNKFKWKSRTYNLKRMALKVFCDYLVKRGQIAENPFKDIRKRKEEKTLPRYLNTTQINLLLEVVEEVFTGNSFLNVRNRTIFYFLLFTGLRLAELRHLRLEDIDFADYQVSVKQGKGNKDRQVPLINALRVKLDKYLSIRKGLLGNNKGEFVFLTENRNILWEHYIYRFFEKVNEKLPFRVTPHMLRHTYATELLRKGVNIFVISLVLGHTDLKTTQVYLGLDTHDIREDLNSKALFLY